MEGLCRGGLLPAGHPLTQRLCFVMGREEVEGGKSQSAGGVSELISAGLGHPRGAYGPGEQC